MDLLSKLNPAQRKAVEYRGGPLLVIAGAGSGKTRVLVFRIAHLLTSDRIPPHRILAVTFTNKAAREMTSRLEELAGPASEEVWMGTFHSICARILRREGKRMGFDPSFSIFDREDQLALVKEAIKGLGLGEDAATARSVIAKISTAKNHLKTPEEFALSAEDHKDEAVAEAFVRYERLLKANGGLDFDDLLLLPIRLFREHPDVLHHYSERFLHLLIDEYQDTNLAQYELVKLLGSTHRDICAVGDDDQSIYRWRGAELGNILEFDKDFSDAKVLRLEQNYRSTGAILAVAHSIIKQNRKRRPKELWTANDRGENVVLIETRSDKEEGWVIADRAQALMFEEGMRWGDVAILYRTNAQSRVLEDSLRRRGIPYVIVGGVRFYERREVKDILAYLRLLVNPRYSVSFWRILNVPARGLGARTRAWLEDVAGREGLPPLEVAATSGEREGLGHAACERLARFAGLIGELREGVEERTAGEVASDVVQRTGYLDHLEKSAEQDWQSRVENVRELVSAAQEYADNADDTSLQAFLEEVSLVADIDGWDDKADAVSLMTLHNAKGLEFPSVFVSGLEEGLLPHASSSNDEDELEEERRLLYVGVTRAMHRAFLTYARERRVFGTVQASVPSHFLQGVDWEYITADRCEETWGTAPSRALWETPGEETRAWDAEGSAAGITVGAPTAARAPQFELGETVVHPDWGDGVVLAIEGAGDSTKVTVCFQGDVTKKILARFGRLSKSC